VLFFLFLFFKNFNFIIIIIFYLGTRIMCTNTCLYIMQDYMGRCIMTLTRVILEGEYKEQFQLDEAKSGKLNLHLKWMPQPIYRDS
jgi:hypothetical protein